MRIEASELLKFKDEFDVEELYSKFPANEREWKTEIWLKHPDERLSDYKLFAEYFLPLPARYRNVKMAFSVQVYLNPLKAGMTWDEARQKNPPSTIYKVSKGQATFGNKNANIHPGKVIVPYTWTQRAKAYDKVKRRVQLTDFLDLRNRLIQGEVEYAVDALDLFDKLFYKFRDELLAEGFLDLQVDVYDDADKLEEKISKLSGQTKHNSDELIKKLKQLKDVTLIRDEISKYARRAFGMPNTVREDALGSESEIEVVFVNDYGLADTAGNNTTVEDDITQEQLLAELEKMKSTK